MTGDNNTAVPTTTSKLSRQSARLTHERNMQTNVAFTWAERARDKACRHRNGESRELLAAADAEEGVCFCEEARSRRTLNTWLGSSI